VTAPTGRPIPPDRFRADIARSVRLLRAFRTEQSDTDGYYTLLAGDTVQQVSTYAAVRGRIVCDVGGGPGYFVRAFRAAGARALCVDADAGELSGTGAPGAGPGPGTAEPGSVLGSALALPLAAGSVDVCFSSNVLEHVPEPRRMLDEMVRVTRPGGIVFCAFTNWLSPWGGHETSPWHYLGGDRAALRYQRRYGRAPKNRYGEGLYPVSVADALGWARGNTAAEVLDAVPRYLPGWTRPLIRVPGFREVLTWNLLLVLRRR
jgi:SAM-dependent methyltransferase